MNTIDLLDKLNFPTKLGLDGDDALFNKKTIMDAYLSAASLQFNSQLYSGESFTSNSNNEGSTYSLNQMCSDLIKPSSVDLFKMLKSDDAFYNQEQVDDMRIVLDINKPTDVANQVMSEVVPYKCQEVSESPEQIETESDSYTKIEAENHKKKSRGKKGDKSDINIIINEERRRLLKKLDSCEGDRIVFKRRVKNSKKNQANAENYRGSKYWGVSKNKSKWQVSLLFV